MNNWVGVVSALIAALAAIVVAIMSLVGARKAQDAGYRLELEQRNAAERAEKERHARDEAQTRAAIEALAYQRARESYERLIKDLEGQLDRNQLTVSKMQTQLDTVLDRLASERDMSNVLRDKLRILQDQINQLRRENEGFRAAIEEHRAVIGSLYSELNKLGITPPPLLDTTTRHPKVGESNAG